MRWRFSLTAVSWFLFLAIATGAPDALAQARPDVFCDAHSQREPYLRAPGGAKGLMSPQSAPSHFP